MMDVEEIPKRTKQLLDSLEEAELLSKDDRLALAMGSKTAESVPRLALQFAARNAKRDDRGHEVIDEIESRFEAAIARDEEIIPF